MFGDWSVSRGAAPICSLTLSNKATADEAYVLQVQQPCDGFVTRFAPTIWRMDMGELVLSNTRGDSWRFSESESGTWRRVPDSAATAILTRK